LKSFCISNLTKRKKRFVYPRFLCSDTNRIATMVAAAIKAMNKVTGKLVWLLDGAAGKGEGEAEDMTDCGGVGVGVSGEGVVDGEAGWEVWGAGGVEVEVGELDGAVVGAGVADGTVLGVGVGRAVTAPGGRGGIPGMIEPLAT
jgi:hypothetical protein